MAAKSPELPGTSLPSHFERSSAEAEPLGPESPKARLDLLSHRPSAESLFGQAAVRETIDALIGAVAAGSGTILLTGNPGTGKTTIVKRLERELRDAGCTVVGFNCAGLEGSEGLVRMLSSDVDPALPGRRVDRWLKSFHYFAAKLNKTGAPIVLVIDGAERLSSDLRSRLGQLLSPAATEPSGLRLILAGRPEILGHAELQPDHDLGRTVRLDRRLERPANRRPTGSSATSLEKTERSGREITPDELHGEGARGPPRDSIQLGGGHPTMAEHSVGHAPFEESHTELSHPAPARPTRRIWAASLVAAGCVAAGCIGMAAAVGGWLVVEKSRLSTNLPTVRERAEESVSSDVRGSSAAAISDPVEVVRSEWGLAADAPSGEVGTNGASRLPDETLAALLRRGDDLLALGDVSGARLLYERAADGGSARAATAAGKAYDPIFFEAARVHGVPPDTVRALAWYRKAIELGDSEAPARLKRLESFQHRIGGEATGIIDDEPRKAMDEELGFAAKSAQNQKVRVETSKGGMTIFERPHQTSTPPPTSMGADVASRLAAMIKGSNLGDHQKMVIRVASVLGTGEFCQAHGVDYRELANTMIAGLRTNSVSDDLPTRMSIDFGVEIGHEGRVYDVIEGTVIDLGAVPDPRSSCDFMHREVVRISRINENPPPPAPSARGAQGSAQGGGTAANKALEAPRTVVLEAAPIGSPVETVQSDTASATNMPPGTGAGNGANELPNHTLAALMKRGDELLALGDLAAARLYYERAAMAGSARAATAAAKTYDPIFVKNSGVRGARPDTVKALAWYRKAIELGDSEAAARLKRLGSFAQQ